MKKNRFQKSETKVIQSHGKSRSPKKLTKMAKKTQKKTKKIEKNVVYDIVKFQFFQKWPFWTPLKTPKMPLFFGLFQMAQI